MPRLVNSIKLPRPGFARIVLAAGLSCMLAPDARCQIFTRLYGGAHLQKSDYARLNAGARKLLDDDANVGSVETWTGTSGVKGTLTLKRIFEKNGYPCRDIESSILYKNGGTRARSVDVCHVPNAGWKIVS